MAQKTEGVVYRNHPLRRIGKTIYYGSMADSHIIQMHVKESRTENDLEIATRVAVELHQRAGADQKSRDRVVSTPRWISPPSGWSGLWPVSNRRRKAHT